MFSQKPENYKLDLENMKLTPTQKKVLYWTILNARAPISRIARDLSLKEHAVRYALQILMDREVITPFTLINIHSLGFTDYCLFLSRSYAPKSAHEGILRRLCSTNGVAWVATVGGEYQYTVSYLARDVYELEEFITDLSVATQTSLFEKSIATRLSWTLFRPNYLASGKRSLEKLVRTKIGSPVVIDDLDRNILRILSTKPLSSVQDIGRKVNTPHSTVDFRIKRMEKSGVIQGYVFNVNAARLGMQAYRLLVYERHSNPLLKTNLAMFCEKHTDVSAFIHCFGDWNYEINLEVEDPRQVSVVSDQIYANFGADIKVIKALSVLETQRVDQYPFQKSGTTNTF